MKVLQVILFVFVHAKLCRSWVDYTVLLTNVWIVYSNDSIVTNVSYYLGKYNSTTTTASLRFTTLYDMNENVQIKSHIAEGLSGGYRETAFFDITIDMCKNVTEMGKPGKFMEEIVHPMFKKYSNIPLSCPYPQGQYYYNDFLMDDKYLPPYFPGDKWRIDFSLLYNGNMVLKGSNVFLIDRTRKLRESLIRKSG